MKLIEIAHEAAGLALKHGANEAAAGAYRGRQVEVDWRDGRVERVAESTTRGLGLGVYVDGRYASVSTCDLRPEALDRFIAQAVALARALAPDPHRRLPDPAGYLGRADVDLELVDPAHAGHEPAERLRMAEALEAAARAAPGAERIRSVSTSVQDNSGESALVQTNGFEGTSRSTSFWVSAEVAVQDPDGRRPEASAASGSRFLAGLEPPEVIGRRAAERAQARIGAVTGGSAVLPMVVEARVAGKLVGQLLGPLSGSSLQQQRSFLQGKLSATVGSRLLDVTDDPLLKRGFGSRLYDGEGLAARPRPVFEEGRLATWFIDSYYGRKLGMAPTTAHPSNLRWRTGARPPEALLAEVGDGILVTGFLGGNSNGTTGDFSLGVRGFRIRGGQLAEPLAEMNISGNHLELWPRLAAVGNDPYAYSALRTPTLVFDGVQFAGT